MNDSSDVLMTEKRQRSMKEYQKAPEKNLAEDNKERNKDVGSHSWMTGTALPRTPGPYILQDNKGTVLLKPRK